MTQWMIQRFVKNHEDIKNPVVRTAYGVLGSIVGICINLLLAGMKYLIGLLTGSLAIAADAANNLSDAGSSIVSLISVRLSQKAEDEDHPFGHGRMEYIGAMIVSFLIIHMGLDLFSSGIEGIKNPEMLTLSPVTLVLMVLSIAFKGWLYFFYKKVGKPINSATLLAAAEDSVSDVIATSAVVISMLAGYYFKLPLDGWMSVVVSILVMRAGYGVFKETMDRILGEKPDPELANSLVNIITSTPGILGVHDMVIHDYGPGRCFASIHAEVPATENILVSHEIIDALERKILEELSVPICIHMDPIVTDDPLVNELKAKMTDFIQTVHPELKLHDFRIVPGEKATNLIFDVLMPASYHEQAQLEAKIRAYAKELDPTYLCVLTFDRNYV